MYYYFMLGLWLTMSCCAASDEIMLQRKEAALQLQRNQQWMVIQDTYIALVSAPWGSVQASCLMQTLQQADVVERGIAQELSACRKLLDTYALPDERLQLTRFE